MQLYRGLPIITNKIAQDEREGIPHHLLDCVDLKYEPWRVSTFVRESQKVIWEIRSRGKQPILVGGTHFYTQALLFNGSLVECEQKPARAMDKRDDVTKADWAILDATNEEMFEKLKVVDPEMARRWHPNDGRKIRRSLEIWLQAGRKASEIYQEQKSVSFDTSDEAGVNSTGGNLSTSEPTLVFWLYAEFETLKKRLDSRVDDMLDAGLLEEAQQLFHYMHAQEEHGTVVDRTRGIWVSIGFKELEEYLSKRGSSTCSSKGIKTAYQAGVEAIKAHTRQYAKSQE